MNENEMKNERNEMSIQILNILIDSLVSIALKSTNDNYVAHYMQFQRKTA